MSLNNVSGSTETMYDRIMTIYEKTSIIGMRAEQLSHGAPSTLQPEILEKMKSVLDIARKEFELRVIPMAIIRTMPNGEKKYLDPEQMEVMN